MRAYLRDGTHPCSKPFLSNAWRIQSAIKSRRAAVINRIFIRLKKTAVYRHPSHVILAKYAKTGAKVAKTLKKLAFI